jgi:hypothetical protein
MREKGRETQGPAVPRKESKKQLNDVGGDVRPSILKKMRLNTTVSNTVLEPPVTTSEPLTATAMSDYMDVLQKEDIAVPQTTSSEDDIMPDLGDPDTLTLIQSVESLITEGIFLDDVLKTYFRREGRRRARGSTPQKTPLSNNSYWLAIAPVPIVLNDSNTRASVLSTLMTVDYTLEDLTSRMESFVAGPLGQPTNKTKLRFAQALTLLAKPAI